MPLHRERVDPIRTPVELEICHRRWLIPDDPERAVAIPQVARLWRGLLDLGVLDPGSEAVLDRLPLPPAGDPEHTELPAIASAGALLGTSSSAAAVSQVVFPDDGRRDPYLEDWWNRNLHLRRGGFDRLLRPAAYSPEHGARHLARPVHDVMFQHARAPLVHGPAAD